MSVLVIFEFDPESGALYVRVRDGKVAETLNLAEPEFGAYMDIDQEGNVLGAEFLSLEEFTELISRSGGVLKLPDQLDPADWEPIRPTKA